MSLLVKNIELKKVHFVGIFGIGMSAIAQYLLGEVDVTGSDRAVDSDATKITQEILAKLGCAIYNQDGSGIDNSTSALVVSTAIEDTNPDIAKAKELGIPVFHRSEILASIVSKSRTISVTGTSGKSTVSSMIFHILRENGISASFIGGANLHSLKDDGLLGNGFRGESDILVIEADESDGTVTRYHPELSLLLNISKDHKSEDEVFEMMKIAANQSKKVVLNGGDKLLSQLDGMTFGMNSSNDFYPTEISLKSTESTFKIDNIEFFLPISGLHNIENVVSAVAAVSQFGVSLKDVSTSLKKYRGVERRFDIYKSKNGGVVIDDYAHNPEKIRAAILSAKLINSKITAVFQPHGFGPLAFMYNELVTMFETVLEKEDRLILLPVFYAGGTVNKTIDSTTVAGKVNGEFEVVLSDSKNSAIKNISKNYRGEVVIVLGARDPSLPQFVKNIAKSV